MIKGKLDYIAPEQIRGEHIDRRADVFSLGAMLWEAVTGQRFSGGSKVQDVTKLHRRLTGGEPKAKELKPDLPDQLANIIDRALAVDAKSRHPTAAALADELEGFLEKMGKRPSAKTLSERLAAPFAGERAKIGWLIEEQVKLAVQSNRSDRKLPSIGRSDLTQSGSGVRPGGLGFSDEGTDAGQGTPVSKVGTQSGLIAAPSIDGLRTPVTATATVQGVQGASQLAPKGILNGPKLIALGAALAAAVGLAVFTGKDTAKDKTGSSGRTTEPGLVATASAAEAPNAQQPQATPTPAPAATVRVHIFVSPPEAHAVMDGASLPKLPFNAELPRDGQLHYVEASAPGYASKRVMVPLDRDREVSIVLDKLPSETPSPVARGGKRRESGVSTSERPVTPAPTGGEKVSNAQSEDIAPGGLIPSKRRVRTDIDTTDPYAN